MSADDGRDIRLDEKQIRVLAHPLRARIPGLLRMGGPATATDLAHLLDTNSGATSYRLRQLAEVGLVEDTGEGIGRRREWRATSDFHSWAPSNFDDRPDAAAAVGWLQRAYLRDFVERAERWEAAAPGWPAEWRDALGLSDTVVEVTPEQARAMHAELADVLDRYRSAGAGDQEAVRLHVTTHAAPLRLSSDGRTAGSRANAAEDESPNPS